MVYVRQETEDVYTPLHLVPPTVHGLISGAGCGVELQTINRRSCTITEKAPTRAFTWLKAATTAFTFKTLLRHYAKQALTPW